MYEHNALGYWSGLALCLTKSEAVEHAVLRQLLLINSKMSFISFLARLYESTGRAIAVTPASASALASASASALLKMLKFLVKVFMSLYLLKLWMDQVDTLHAGRYWSEVLCCTVMTHLGDLEVKVTDLEILC